LDGTGSFTVQDLLFDEAGHVTANQAHTYNLPYAVRNIKVNSTNAVTAGSNTAGTIEADKYNDEFILTSQNRWVTLKADTANDTISIGHAAAGGTTITTA
jgi:xanthine dehydrogenase molybdopterin-binding subunit B